ncbi:MAG: hypothetical protein ABH858_03935 [Candidatus Omnitrophota bacterium]
MERKTKKRKSLVCVICKGDKKISLKKKCCGPKITAKEKGSWNM